MYLNTSLEILGLISSFIGSLMLIKGSYNPSRHGGATWAYVEGSHDDENIIKERDFTIYGFSLLAIGFLLQLLSYISANLI